MFLHCVNTSIHKQALAIAVSMLLAFVSACSSSPTKDAAEGNAQESSKGKTTAKRSESKDAAGMSAEAVPVGPPPVPPEAMQQYEKALTLLSAGDFTAAAKDLQQLSETYPDYSGPLANLGIVYLKTGKLPEAEKALKAATQRGDPSAAAFNQLGIVYRKLGRFKEADAAYTEALRIDPGYALAHLNLGVLCDMYLQQPQRALTEFERYLQLVPNPDARVPTWVKELRARLGVKSPSTEPAAAPNPSAEPIAKQETASL
jgi:tetratricopeptide (TPR) repeat protein